MSVTGDLAGGPPSSPEPRIAQLLRAKQRSGSRIAVVIPARNEAATVANVVTRVAEELMHGSELIDELVVMDSLSSDDTGAIAAASGAVVHSVADVRPDLGVQAGKGEALWKSLFVTEADLLVFIDADLVEWGTHFVTSLIAPLLAEPTVQLVKGFYDRLFDDHDGGDPATTRPQGGRVTELVARPLLGLRWPQLAGIVQPLAGEWAIRRSLLESLSVPVGYGIELATLIDTFEGHGLEAIAQVDLGRRAHRHQTVHDLAVMAAEIIAVADRRSGLGYASGLTETTLAQYDRAVPGNWLRRPVPLGERPPQMKEAQAPD